MGEHQRTSSVVSSKTTWQSFDSMPAEDTDFSGSNGVDLDKDLSPFSLWSIFEEAKPVTKYSRIKINNNKNFTYILAGTFVHICTKHCMT